jgi:hypothetical protein
MSIFQASVNITPAERVGRVVVGVFGLVGAALLFRGATGPVAVFLLLLLGLAGLDMVVTGASGHCPLYKKLGRLALPAKGRTS